nr:MAG TPA: hypothetical protein [Caudoviricetes sp.]DAV17524.1 MAG TPA: hypothetical protein [Caudoviricetes sp.]
MRRRKNKKNIGYCINIHIIVYIYAIFLLILGLK